MLKKKVHWSLSVLAISAMTLGFFDVPFFAAAEEIKMNTPIIRHYKVAQEAVAPAPVVELLKPNEPAPQPNPSTEGQKPPPLQPQDGQPNQTQPAPMGPTMKDGQAMEEQGMEMEFVDPREVKRVLQEIKNMKSELNRFIKQLKKMPNSADDIATCQDILNKINEHYKTISNPPGDMSVRDAMQEFYEGQYWETVNAMRAKIELPKQLAEVAKQLKKVQKLVKQKAYQNLGFDMTAINQHLADIQTIYDEANAQYKNGELEDAMETMQDIFQGTHPGELYGLLSQFRQIKLQIKSIKNAEVKAIIDEILSEVISSVNDGDFRDANMTLQQIQGELMKLASKYMKGSSVLNDDMRAKFDKLEGIVQDKLGDKAGEITEQPKE